MFVLSIGIVSASSVVVTLNIPRGGYKNIENIFSEGTYFADVQFDSYYDPSCTDSKVAIDLTDVATGKLLGYTEKKVILKSSVHQTFGYGAGGHKIFSFSTNVKGTKYCGFVSNYTRVGT